MFRTVWNISCAIFGLGLVSYIIYSVTRKIIHSRNERYCTNGRFKFPEKSQIRLKDKRFLKNGHDYSGQILGVAREPTGDEYMIRTERHGFKRVPKELIEKEYKCGQVKLPQFEESGGQHFSRA